MPSAAADTQKVEREAGKLARLKLVTDQNTENLKKAEKLNRKYMRALEESQSQPNVTQVAVATVACVAGSVGGYAINKKVRAYTEEKKWVNAKGERSIGAVFVTDVLLPAVGLVGMVGGAYIDNGPLSAGVMGASGGLAGGSLVASINAPKKK